MFDRVCKVTLTFESVDEILWCDHNLSACTFTRCYLFVKILDNEIGNLLEILRLATFGSERVKERCHEIYQNLNRGNCHKIK